jgi:Flp pilus assembly pilin Flp
MNKREKNSYREKNSISVVEYTVFILVIILALIGMSKYLRRAISGKWKTSIDTYGWGRQYNPDR